jgi:hypothetical protein
LHNLDSPTLLTSKCCFLQRLKLLYQIFSVKNWITIGNIIIILSLVDNLKTKRTCLSHPWTTPPLKPSEPLTFLTKDTSLRTVWPSLWETNYPPSRTMKQTHSSVQWTKMKMVEFPTLNWLRLYILWNHSLIVQVWLLNRPLEIRPLQDNLKPPEP